MSPEVLLQWFGHYGYVALFSMLMIGILGLPIPDEIILSMAGYLLYRGELEWFPTYAAAFLGSACGITTSYILGRFFGFLIQRWHHGRPDAPNSPLGRIAVWFKRYGRWLLIFGYYLPGIRHGSALLAGMVRYGFPGFVRYAYLGAFIWSASFITLSAMLGKEWNYVLASAHRILVLGLILLAFYLTLNYFLYWRKRKIRK